MMAPHVKYWLEKMSNSDNIGYKKHTFGLLDSDNPNAYFYMCAARMAGATWTDICLSVSEMYEKAIPFARLSDFPLLRDLANRAVGALHGGFEIKGVDCDYYEPYNRDLCMDIEVDSLDLEDSGDPMGCALYGYGALIDACYWAVINKRGGDENKWDGVMDSALSESISALEEYLAAVGDRGEKSAAAIAGVAKSNFLSLLIKSMA